MQSIQNNIRKTVGQHRQDIDGLRALAVAAVVLNHLNKDWCVNGYLGVDVFFVISGFVVTHSILNRLSVDPTKTFTMKMVYDFYARRIRRLVPTLVLITVLTTLFLGLFVRDLQLSLRTGATAILGLSNFYLLRQDMDYFGGNSLENFFLHTWSLGVEEQFYFIFPWLFVLSYRFFKNARRSWFVICSALSLLSFGLWCLPDALLSESFQFYMMPTRFWQIGLGALLAYKSGSMTDPVMIRFENALKTASLVALVLLMFIPVEDSALSRTLSVLFTLGLIGLSGQSYNEGLCRSLSQTPAQWTGLRSYSIYLWHWPVICAFRWTIGLNELTAICAVAVACVLSEMSYRLVESRLRNRSFVTGKPLSLATAFGCMVCISLLLFTSQRNWGNLYLGDQSRASQARELRYELPGTSLTMESCRSGDDLNPQVDESKLLKCVTENVKGAETVALIGDSHSWMLLPIFEELNKNQRSNVFAYFRDGCPFPAFGEHSRPGCEKIQTQIQDFILAVDPRFSTVVISNYWLGHFGYNGSHRDQSHFLANGSQASVLKAWHRYIEKFEDFLEATEKEGMKVIVIGPGPKHPKMPITPELCEGQWFRTYIDASCDGSAVASMDEDIFRLGGDLKQLSLKFSHVHYFDLYSQFCDEIRCPVLDEGGFLFVDDNHLSRYGTKKIALEIGELLVGKNGSQ